MQITQSINHDQSILVGTNPLSVVDRAMLSILVAASLSILHATSLDTFRGEQMLSSQPHDLDEYYPGLNISLTDLNLDYSEELTFLISFIPVKRDREIAYDVLDLINFVGMPNLRRICNNSTPSISDLYDAFWNPGKVMQTLISLKRFGITISRACSDLRFIQLYKQLLRALLADPTVDLRLRHVRNPILRDYLRTKADLQTIENPALRSKFGYVLNLIDLMGYRRMCLVFSPLTTLGQIHRIITRNELGEKRKSLLQSYGVDCSWSLKSGVNIRSHRLTAEQELWNVFMPIRLIWSRRLLQFVRNPQIAAIIQKVCDCLDSTGAPAFYHVFPTSMSVVSIYSQLTTLCDLVEVIRKYATVGVFIKAGMKGFEYIPASEVLNEIKQYKSITDASEPVSITCSPIVSDWGGNNDQTTASNTISKVDLGNSRDVIEERSNTSNSVTKSTITVTGPVRTMLQSQPATESNILLSGVSFNGPDQKRAPGSPIVLPVSNPLMNTRTSAAHLGSSVVETESECYISIAPDSVFNEPPPIRRSSRLAHTRINAPAVVSKRITRFRRSNYRRISGKLQADPASSHRDCGNSAQTGLPSEIPVSSYSNHMRVKSKSVDDVREDTKAAVVSILERVREKTVISPQ